MESASGLVYGADNDNRMREALSALLRANRRDVRAFNSGKAFLDTPRQSAVSSTTFDA